jgi:hypothetical protein
MAETVGEKRPLESEFTKNQKQKLPNKQHYFNILPLDLRKELILSFPYEHNTAATSLIVLSSLFNIPLTYSFMISCFRWNLGDLSMPSIYSRILYVRNEPQLIQYVINNLSTVEHADMFERPTISDKVDMLDVSHLVTALLESVIKTNEEKIIRLILDWNPRLFLFSTLCECLHTNNTQLLYKFVNKYLSASLMLKGYHIGLIYYLGSKTNISDDENERETILNTLLIMSTSLVNENIGANVIKFLVQKGAKSYDIALHRALMNTHYSSDAELNVGNILNSVTELINCGVDFERYHKYDLSRLCHTSKLLPLVEYLVTSGMRIMCEALMQCVRYSNFSMFEYLITQVNSLDKDIREIDINHLRCQRRYEVSSVHKEYYYRISKIFNIY